MNNHRQCSKSVIRHHNCSRVTLLSAAVLSVLATSASADVQTGLVAHIPFDDGQVVDQVGTLQGVIRGATAVPGELGSALDFDGNAYVEFTNTASLPTGFAPRSLSVWAKGVKDDSGVVVSYGTSNPFSSEPVFHLDVSDNPAIGNFVAGGGSFSTAPQSGQVINFNSYQPNQWQHYVLTYDGVEAVLYVDGVEVQRGERTWNISAADFAYVGRWQGNYFTGSVDELRLYDRVLSSADVAELHQLGLDTASAAPLAQPVASGPIPEPVAYYSFDDSDPYADVSGFGHDGVPFGPSQVVDGIIGQALDLPNGSFVELAAGETFPSGDEPRTIMGWIRPNDLNSSATILSYGSGNQLAFLLRSFSGAGAGGGLSLARDLVVFGGVFQPGEWHHLAMSYDGEFARLFVDGQERQTSLRDWFVTPGAATLGSMAGGSRFANGALDEVRVYDQSLSPEQIETLFRNEQGLVSRWTLDNTSTTDAVGQVDGVNHGAEPVPGQIGSAFAFDGNDYIEFTDVSSLPRDLEPRSLSVWAKGDLDGDGGVILGYGSRRSDLTHITASTFAVRAGGNLGTAPNSGDLFAYGAYVAGQWQHYVMTYDGADAVLYVDGVEVVRGQRTWNAANPQLGAIGRWDHVFFEGMIDDPRIYDRALTAADVAQLYADGLAAPSAAPEGEVVVAPLPAPVAAYSFDSETPFADDSGQGHDGVAEGAPLLGLGVLGNALVLDGSSALSLTDSLSLPSGLAPRSISTWVRSDNNSGSGFAVSYGQQHRYAFLARSGSAAAAGGFRSGATDLVRYGIIQQGVWHHLVMVYDGDIARLFVDGVEQLTARREGGLAWNIIPGPATIGRLATGGRYWVGALDEVRIYDEALLPEQVDVLYQEGIAP